MGGTAEQEQRRVRTAALGVHLAALVLSAVLVGVEAWTLAAAVFVIALAAGAWAVKLYNDLREQVQQDRAMLGARARFVDPPARTGDPFEG